MSQAFWGFCVGLERVLFEFIGDMDIADFDDKYHLWDSMDPKVTPIALPLPSISPPSSALLTSSDHSARSQGEELLSWMTITDPKKEEEGFPRMLVENRIYTSSKFRKMHLELAWKQDGLQVLHIVLFPNDNLDIPIFGVDMVAFGDNVSLAIVDLHPASMSGQLPPIYTQVKPPCSLPRSAHVCSRQRPAAHTHLLSLAPRQAAPTVALCVMPSSDGTACISAALRFLSGSPCVPQGFEMVMEKYGMRSRVSRQLPDWQQEISSDYVVAMRPETGGIYHSAPARLRICIARIFRRGNASRQG